MSKQNNSKSNNIIHNDSFLQVDLLNSYRYVQHLADILDLFPEQARSKHYEIKGGLNIQSPISGIKEVRINEKGIWANLDVSNNFLQTLSHFCSVAEQITNIIDEDTYVRIGWRNSLIQQDVTAEQFDSIRKKFSPAENYLAEGVQIQSKQKDVNFVANISFGIDESIEPISYGFILDVDSSMTGEFPLSSLKDNLNNLDDLLWKKKSLSKLLKEIFRTNE